MGKESQAKVVLRNPARLLNFADRSELFFCVFLNNKAPFLAVGSMHETTDTTAGGKVCKEKKKYLCKSVLN